MWIFSAKIHAEIITPATPFGKDDYSCCSGKASWFRFKSARAMSRPAASGIVVHTYLGRCPGWDKAAFGPECCGHV